MRSKHLLPPSEGIGLPTGKKLAMSRSETQRIVQCLHDDMPVDPYDVERFLRTDYDPVPSLVERILRSPVPTLALIIGASGSKWILDSNAAIGTSVHMPESMHRFLNYLWQWLPPDMQAHSSDILQHLPGLLATLAVGGILGGVWQLSKARGLNARAHRARQALHERIAHGTAKWDLSKHKKPLVAYIGRSSLIAKYMAEESGQLVVRVAYSVDEIDGPSVKLAGNAGLEEALVAFEHADVLHAQLVIFPGTAGYELFPPVGNTKEAYDSGIARSEGVIRRNLQLRTAARRQIKPVVIIGNGEQPINYVAATDGRHLRASVSSDTLASHMKTFEQELAREYNRACPIYVIDPSQLVAAQIIAILGARNSLPPLHFVGTESSVDTFAPGFYAVMKASGYQPKKGTKPVRVVYNSSDRATEDLATSAFTVPGDIFIVQDPARGDVLVKEGVAAENVIVVPRLVKRELDRVLAERT